jgi:copper-binding protein NosD
VTELVKVNKPLIIRGARAGVDARDPSRGQGETIVNGAPLSDGKQSTSFYITASGVTIDGFTIQDDSSSNVYGAGIVIAPGVHGTKIVNNVIQSNVAGVYLANNSNADPALIQHNVFKNNNNAGDNSGRGIYSDGGVSGGNLTRVVIDSNTFVNNVGFGPPENPEAAIGLEAKTAGKQANITITNNIMTGNGKGVLLYNIDRVLIDGNVMTASTDANSAAIRIEGNATNVTVAHNTVTGSLGAAMRISNIFTGPSSLILVTQNNFFGNAKGGLRVEAGGFTGTMDARNNWWGSDSGPSGDANGLGDSLTAPDNNVLFSPWSTAPITITQGDAGTPRGLRQILIQDLATLRSQIHGHLQHLIKDAITNFKATLADNLWLDDSHLAPGAGQDLFDLDRKAVGQLRKIIRPMKKIHGLPTGLVETVQRVVNLERMMAMIAIDAAGAGDAKKLAKANAELAAGAKDQTAGNYDAAIAHFQNAWGQAIDASKSAKAPKHKHHKHEGDRESD